MMWSWASPFGLVTFVKVTGEAEVFSKVPKAALIPVSAAFAHGSVNVNWADAVGADVTAAGECAAADEPEASPDEDPPHAVRVIARAKMGRAERTKEVVMTGVLSVQENGTLGSFVQGGRKSGAD